jgi:hypothetical protein
MQDFARKVFSGGDTEHVPCQDCGGVHTRACPRISSIKVVINELGVIVERDVTYWAPGKWEDGIIFADDVWEGDDDGEADGSGSE